MDRPLAQGLGVDAARLAASALLHKSADVTEEFGISSSVTVESEEMLRQHECRLPGELLIFAKVTEW